MKRIFAFTAALLLAALAHAQDPAASYPSKTIRIFGQGTGSTADYLSRYLAQKLTERWGQPVIVDSRAGAGGAISTDLGAKSAGKGAPAPPRLFAKRKNTPLNSHHTMIFYAVFCLEKKKI